MIDGDRLVVGTLQIEGDASLVTRPPEPGDHIFLTPTKVNPAAAVVHALVLPRAGAWRHPSATGASPGRAASSRPVMSAKTSIGRTILLFFGSGRFGSAGRRAPGTASRYRNSGAASNSLRCSASAYLSVMPAM